MNRSALTAFLRQNTVLILMILAAVVGLVFIFLIPPWQNGDEPGHFEYAWLAANRPGWPREDDYDQDMRRELAASMIEHDFQNYPTAILLQTDQPISIITPQTGDVPLYYFLASLPLRLVRHTDIAFQLYLTRFVSFALFLGTVWLAAQSARLVFGPGYPAAWMAPLFMICLATFVENMTSANNDAAAVFALSLFVWLSLRILTNGWSLLHGLGLAVSLGLCLLSKSTAWMGLPLAGLIVPLSLIRKKHLKYAWLVIGAGLLLGTALLVSWRESAPAFFYAENDRLIPKRTAASLAPVGDFVLTQSDIEIYKQQFFYGLTDTAGEAIRGKTVTLGVYIWAQEPITLEFPVLAAPFTEEIIPFTSEKVSLSTEPRFFAFSARIPDDRPAAWYLQFSAIKAQGNTLYWDGLVLVPGEMPAETRPEYLDPDGQVVRWAGEKYQNLVRNGSGEKPWPVLSGFLREHLPSPIQFSISHLFSFTDWQTHGWYWRVITTQIFRTFWGKFGWTQVPLTGAKPYRILLVWSGLTLAGAAIGLIQNTSKVRVKTLIFLGTAIAAQVFLVTFRGMGRWFSPSPYIPVGRYLFPALIPISLSFAWGWYEGSVLFRKRTQWSFPIVILIYGISCLALLVWSIISLVSFFN